MKKNPTETQKNRQLFDKEQLLRHTSKFLYPVEILKNLGKCIVAHHRNTDSLQYALGAALHQMTDDIRDFVGFVFKKLSE